MPCAAFVLAELPRCSSHAQPQDLFPRNFKEASSASAAGTVLGGLFNFITEQMAEANSWRSSRRDAKWIVYWNSSANEIVYWESFTESRLLRVLYRTRLMGVRKSFLNHRLPMSRLPKSFTRDLSKTPGVIIKRITFTRGRLPKSFTKAVYHKSKTPGVIIKRSRLLKRSFTKVVRLARSLPERSFTTGTTGRLTESRLPQVV